MLSQFKILIWYFVTRLYKRWGNYYTYLFHLVILHCPILAYYIIINASGCYHCILHTDPSITWFIILKRQEIMQQMMKNPCLYCFSPSQSFWLVVVVLLFLYYIACCNHNFYSCLALFLYSINSVLPLLTTMATPFISSLAPSVIIFLRKDIEVLFSSRSSCLWY